MKHVLLKEIVIVVVQINTKYNFTGWGGTHGVWMG